MSVTKAQAIARKLKPQLDYLFPAPLIVIQDNDPSDGFPILAVAESVTPATGQQTMVIKILPESQLFLNTINGTQEGFCPHDVKMVVETGLTAGSTYVTAKNLGIMHSLLAKTGGIYQFYMRANGSNPVVADMTTANLQFALDPDIYNKLTAQ